MTALSLAEARDAARERMASATLGKDPHAERAAEKARAATTFGSVVKLYLARTDRRLRASSFEDVRRYLEVACEPLHPMPLADMKRRDVADRLEAIADKSGPYASNRARAALSSLFSWAMSQGRAEFNPVIGTVKAGREVARDRVLSNAELIAVWNAAGADDFGRIVRLLILTAQRRDEVASMRWSELDLATTMWWLPAERTKNKRPHDVPLSPAAVAILDGVTAIEGRDLVFGKHGKGGFSGFSKLKAGLDKASGVTGWRLHDLRRTAITGMAALGTNLPVIERIVNHVSGSFGGIVGVYQRHTYAVEKTDALDRWADHVLKLVSASTSTPEK